MTYEEAMRVCRRGMKVRCKAFGRGWAVFYIPSGAAKGFYVLNPHTGSNYTFRPTPEYMAAKDWTVLNG